MNAAVVQPVPVVEASPVQGFSDCHRALLRGLRSFSSLPDLVHAAERSRAVAQATLQLFEIAVLGHHADEEGDLFPAVLRSAHPGEEREQTQVIVDRLVAEHRSIETLWTMTKPAVERAAAGRDARLDAEAVAALVYAYNRHAVFEELEFLPRAAEILGRNGNHMAALGLSLHLRHAPSPVGYI